MAKGSKFERDLCTQLSLWWTNNRRDDVFWRTAGSGARATSRSKQGRQTCGQYGDICATDPIGEPLIQALTIEAKNGYSRSTIHDILDRTDRTAVQRYEEFFTKAINSSIQAGSVGWALVHKRNFRQPMIYLPHYILTFMRRKKSGVFPYVYFELDVRGKKKKPEHTIYVVGMSLDSFFSEFTPKDIKKLVC